jgi:hypothetical protein
LRQKKIPLKNFRIKNFPIKLLLRGGWMVQKNGLI